MDCKQVFSVIDNMNDRYCDLWEKVCNIESPTDYKKGVDEVGNVFLEMAKARGWFVEILEDKKAGNAICITVNPESEESSVVFSGHIDTVHPIGYFGTPAVRRDQKCLYGPGVMDCKGGVVASMMALDALDQCGFKKRPVKLVIQSDEETGSRTSNKKTISFMLEKSKNAVAFLNTEGTQGATAVLIRKGILRYRFTVHGKAVHASICAQGANAIAEAAYKIIELEKMKDAKGLTCNCGVIEGGTAENSVADCCVFSADIRFADKAQYDEAVAAVQRVANNATIPGCSCTVEKRSERPSMPKREKNTRLLEKMNEIYKQCGLPELIVCSTLGGSDAAYTTEAGIPTVDNLGVDGGEIHSINEYAYLNSLAASAKRLAAVALCI